MLRVAIGRISSKSGLIHMSSSSPDDTLLLIRCPNCGQRFKVGEDLRERTVECGGCESRFKINDNVIVRGPKFYPGERSGHDMNRFQRVPLAGAESLIGVQPIRYANMPDASLLEPMSPQRIIAGVIGVSGIVIMCLMLILGANRGGLLDGMVTEDRLMMAGFTCIVGVFLLVYANPKARIKALLIGLLLSSGPMAAPFLFQAGSVPLPPSSSGGVGETVSGPVDDAKPVYEENSISALKNRIGTGPLDTEIARLAAEGSTKRALGVWFRGLSDSNRFLVRDYIIRVTDADLASHFYPRNGGDYLMVLTGVRLSLEELAEFTAALGQTEKIYPEISVIEVRVRTDAFVEGSIEKLSKKEDPAFYDLNKRELESIDLERVKRAVQRIAEVEPKIYRADITRKLISLLGDEGVDFKGNVSKALSVWSEHPGPAGNAALNEVKKLLKSEKVIPPEMMSLIVKEKNPGIIPILDGLWYGNPMLWESIYGDLGSPAEPALIRRFPDTKGITRYSAVRILGRVGGADSLPVLAAALPNADSELKVLIEQSQQNIASRLNH
jgi:hypothetical protein